jgi:hypothetical protein
MTNIFPRTITSENSPKSIYTINADNADEHLQCAHDILPDDLSPVSVVIWTLSDQQRADRISSISADQVQEDLSTKDPFFCEYLTHAQKRSKAARARSKIQSHSLTLKRHFDSGGGNQSSFGLTSIFDRWKHMNGIGSRVICNDVPLKNGDSNAGTLFWDLDEIKDRSYFTKLRCAGFNSAASHANKSDNATFSRNSAWKMRPSDIAIVMVGGKAGKLKLPLHSQDEKNDGDIRILNRIFM